MCDYVVSNAALHSNKKKKKKKIDLSGKRNQGRPKRRIMDAARVRGHGRGGSDRGQCRR